MPLPIELDKKGKPKIARAGQKGNTPEQRKELDRLRLLELRKLGDERKLENEQWFEEKYKGEKVAGPDDFKPAMGHDWGEAASADEDNLVELGIKRVRVSSPKDLEDLKRLRKPATLNWEGMKPEFREWMIETSEGDLSGDSDAAVASISKYGPLKDRNRIRGTFKHKGKVVDSWTEISKHPQFDVRGWRFDASQHQGGGTTENLPWAERYRDGGPSSRATWNKYIRPYLLDDGETLGLMWINPRMPKGLTAERVINDYLSFNEKPNIFMRTDAVIGESTRLAKEANWKEEAAYRDEDYADERKRKGEERGEDLEGTVPSASKGPLSPAMKAKKTIRIRSAEDEERKLMEEPLKKGKK
jgi:hypothetical protein